jgi:hypothetical protein
MIDDNFKFDMSRTIHTEKNLIKPFETHNNIKYKNNMIVANDIFKNLEENIINQKIEILNRYVIMNENDREWPFIMEIKYLEDSNESGFGYTINCNYNELNMA